MGKLHDIQTDVQHLLQENWDIALECVLDQTKMLTMKQLSSKHLFEIETIYSISYSIVTHVHIITIV